MIDTSPCDTEKYVWEIDRKRIACQEISYNGKRITEDSKWVDAHTHLWRCYECLVNCGSTIREIGQASKSETLKKLAYYSNDKGEIKELVRFQQHFSQIKL